MFNKKILILFVFMGIILLISHILVDMTLFDEKPFGDNFSFHLFHFAIVIIAGIIFAYYYQRQENKIINSLNEVRQFKLFADNTSDFIAILDSDGNFLYLNEYASEFVAGNENKISNLKDFIPDDKYYEIINQNGNKFEELTNKIETDFKLKSGNISKIEFKTGSTNFNDEKRILLAGRDITEHIEKNREIEHLNSILQALLNINRIITQEDDIEQVIDKIVKELVAERRYTTCWIILFDENLKVNHYAESGLGLVFDEFIEFLDEKGITKHLKEAMGNKNINFALKNTEDCKECPLFEYEDVGRTMLHSISFKNKVFGTISVTIPDDYSISSREFDVFTEIANDIGYALHINEVKKEKQFALNRYRMQFEEAMDAILLADAETGKIIDCNRQTEVLFNANRNFVIGKHQSELHPDDGRDYKSDFEKHKNQKGSEVIDSNILTKDGIIKEVSVKASLFKYEGKAYLQGIFRDVSAQIKLKNELKNIFELSMDIICTVRISDNKFIKVNPAFEEILGYDESDIRGMAIIDFVHPNDKLPTLKLIDKLLKRGKKVVGFENRFYTKAGDIIWIDWIVNPVPEEDIFYAVGHNVTERKKREKQLIEQNSIIETEKRYNESLLTAMPDMLFVLNREGHFINYHSNSKELFYRDPTDFIYQKIEDVMPKDITKLTYEKIHKVLETKKPEVFNYSLNSNGKHEHYESRMVAVDNMHVLSIVRNISDTVRYQKELILAKEKAEESDRLKSAFLANMSHELRTPLNGILGFAQIMMEGADSEKEYKEYANTIFTSGDYLLNLINDIIDISKLEAGQMTIYNNDFDLNALMDDIYTMIESIIKVRNKDVELELVKNNQSRIIANSDDTKILQILNNLLSNSVKFTHKGKIKFGYSLEDDDMILFYVKDTGIGIPKSHKNEIFKRFRQVDRKDGKMYGGTGLGLSISKACAEMLGGEIWFNSEVNKGTDFYFTIKLNKVIIENY